MGCHYKDVFNLEKEEQQKTRIQMLSKQQAMKKEEENNIVKCPKCGCTSIGLKNRGYSLFWGFLGSGSPRNVCQKCGYEWRP